MTRLALGAALLATGCFDSLVTGECRSGWVDVGGECRRTIETETDAGAVAPDAATNPDALPSPDALICSPPTLACGGECVDPMTDADHCGACNSACFTGLCEAGACVGEIAGHVVLIGHDYVDHHGAMARVLANAAALSSRTPIRIEEWRGTASGAAVAGANLALEQGLAAIGRPWLAVDGEEPIAGLVDVDVFLVHAQRGDGDAMAATGTAWKPMLAEFRDRGGVVIVLEGAQGTSYRFASAAELVPITAIADCTGAVTIAKPADGVAIGVPAPYLAAGTSAWFATSSSDVVVIDAASHAVVVHVAE